MRQCFERASGSLPGLKKCCNLCHGLVRLALVKAADPLLPCQGFAWAVLGPLIHPLIALSQRQAQDLPGDTIGELLGAFLVARLPLSVMMRYLLHDLARHFGFVCGPKCPYRHQC